jgi:hypothetical protein
MKKNLSLLLLAFLVSCATSDPMVTGKPQDWKGKPASDLKSAWGEPTRIIPSSTGAEVWEYARSADYVIPKGENMRLGFAGLGAASGGAGGFSLEKRPEDRNSREDELFRFKIRNGKIIQWYAARFVDGRKVWEDQ